MTHPDDAPPQNSLVNRGHAQELLRDKMTTRSRVPTDTGQLNRPPDRRGRKRGQTLIPNTGSGRRQHLGASPSFRGRLAVLMAQGESGYWPGSGAALADRIQETLTLLRLMYKRASKFLWVR